MGNKNRPRPHKPGWDESLCELAILSFKSFCLFDIEVCFFLASFMFQAIISRGLQLEGQVVTEEQDLQVIVSTNQKSSPIQYLHASAMQDRVRAAVAQSQASCFFQNCLRKKLSWTCSLVK